MKIMYRLCESVDEINKAQAGHLRVSVLFVSRFQIPHSPGRTSVPLLSLKKYKLGSFPALAQI